MPGEKTFTVINPIPGQPDQNDPVNHGCCVASKVAGPQFGVAKNVNVVMLRLPFPANPDEFLDAAHVMTALFEVYSSVMSRGLRKKAVVNMSLGCKYINPTIGKLGLTSTLVFLDQNSPVLFSIRYWIDKLIENDVVIVAASGNTRVRVF